jgi:Ca2+-binding EF-hand superfamily protein
MRNYAQTVPSRFIKDMRKATDVNGDNEITMSEMKNMLKNIGADDKISDDELKSLFDEVGADLNGERVIHVDDMVKVWKEHSTVL